jgi:hypothetical protein
MIAPRRDCGSAEILADAARWRLYGLLLSRPTDERRTAVQALLPEVDAPELGAAARAWCAHASEGAYLHLLGPGGIVPARAVAYRAFSDPGWVLADIARYHDAFAFHALTDEPTDHVAVLIELVSYLFLKEAYARECGDDAAADLTRDAREQFVTEHLVPVIGPLAARLDACGATEWATAPRLLATQLPAPTTTGVPTRDDDAPRCGGCVGPGT